MTHIQIKRIYDSPNHNDGYRILIDRLWPRGISKDTANIDLWAQDIAPSHELRKWYKHETDKYPEFKKRYLAELADHNQMARDLLNTASSAKRITLLTATKEMQHNHAVVLKEYLETLV